MKCVFAALVITGSIAENPLSLKLDEACYLGMMMDILMTLLASVTPSPRDP